MRDYFCGDVHAGIAFTAADELDAYRLMLLVRRFEEKAGQLYALGAITGACPLSIGQEGVIAGLAMATVKGDRFVAGFRSHGFLLACGTSPERLFAGMMGRETGLAHGRGGAVHLFDSENGFFGGHARAAVQVPLAAGLAFAARYRGETAVAIAALGDGAAKCGLLAETLQLAAAERLPLVIAIENNCEAAVIHSDGAGALPALSDCGAALGIPGLQSDGIDVRRVRAAARRAVDHARFGEGPFILEFLTHRYRGHADAPVPGRAGQSREETDPVAKSRDRILTEGFATETDLKALEKDVRDGIAQAASAARAAPGAGGTMRGKVAHAAVC